MKKWIPAALALLAVWNIYLTYSSHSFNAAVTGGRTTVQNTVNGYTTDVTETVKKVASSIVSVTCGDATFSGVIYAKEDKTSYIITEASSLDGGSEIHVIFDSGAKVEAHTVATDREDMIALLKVETDFETSPIEHGDADLLSRGEYVIGISGRSADTAGGTVTFGVTNDSALFRSNETTKWLTQMMETDLTVTDNQMGAPLVNLSGEMVGILVPTPFNGNEGMAYAVTADEIQNAYKDFLKDEGLTRGSLGITVRSVSGMKSYEKNQTGLALDLDYGVRISNVLRDSSAYGYLEEGDVVAEIDGSKVKDVSDYLKKMYGYETGDTISIVYIRNGETNTISVTLL